jgi:two-component system response regulator HydG
MSSPRVIVVDDNLEMAGTIAEGLVDRGYDAVAVASGQEALARLRGEKVDALVTDLRMPKVDGLELLAESRKLDPERPVIVMTAYSAIDTAVESIRQGAYHYLTKPFKQDELVIFLQRALDDVRLKRETLALKTALRTRFSGSSIIGHSPAIQAVRERIARVADAPAPVIIFGETGTGKGLVARALHADSHRAGRPFVSVNCAALPEPLLESELFGYVKGAFTGAVSDRAGLFAEADGGSLFLDEIAEMPPALQAKLLHVLESGTVRPVGAARQRGRVQRGPSLSPGCRLHRRAELARSPGGHPGALDAFPARITSEVPAVRGARLLRQGHGPPAGLPVAGQRSRARAHGREAGAARAFVGDRRR